MKPDLSVEANRLALMEQAGCDVQCGLTWDQASGQVTHHRRVFALGPSPAHEITRSVKVETEKRLVAWMQKQHTD